MNRPKKGIAFEDRFWVCVDVCGDDECWNWLGSKNQDGYGNVWDGKTTLKSHRVSWLFLRGEIPNGLQVLHHCDNPPCCNPKHLFLGTNRDNVSDRVAKGRSGSAKRENHGRAKLTWEQVREIRMRYIPHKFTEYQLSDEYGVTQAEIHRILAGKLWREEYVPSIV